MKTKLKKAACLFLSTIFVALLPVSTHAAESTSHIHSENCVYSCELDVIEATGSHNTSTHGHTNHADDDNCRYSCVSATDSRDDIAAARAKNQAFFEAYRNVSSDAELEILIADYFGIDRSEFDLVGLRNAAEAVHASYIDETFVKEYSEISSREDMIGFIAKYANVSSSDAELIMNKSAAEFNGSLDQLFCNHSYLAGSCEGDHYGRNNCMVWCIRTAACMHRCGAVTEVTIHETDHNWSVGWCGQTCKDCGLVEMFHESGGCWYCKKYG